MNSRRDLPQDLEAERAILGSMLLNNELAIEVNRWIKTDQIFYLPANRNIFNAMFSLYENLERFDEVLISDELKRSKLLVDSGGLGYLAELIDSVPTSGNIKHYCDIVLERYKERRLLLHLSKVTKAIQTGNLSSSQTLSELEKEKELLQEFSTEERIKSLSDVLRDESFVELEKMSNAEEEYVSGYKTGFLSLDSYIPFIEKNDMVVVGARPGMGKTAFALCLADHMTSSHKNRGLFISYEMVNRQIANRYISFKSNISASKIKTAELNAEDWDKLALCARDSNQYLELMEGSGLSFSELKSEIKRYVKNVRSKGEEVGVIVLDYLQLVSLGNSLQPNMYAEVSTISREIKALANQLSVPMVALSQLNRNIESRPMEQREPRVSDLRESGQIEQDADLILLLHRQSIYDPTMDETRAKLIIAKNRSGKTGAVDLHYQGDLYKFSDLKTDSFNFNL